MAKQTFTADEALDLLISMNPLRLGVNANPLVEKDNQFIITGKRKTIKGIPNVEAYVDMTKITEAGKAANPGLVAGRYIRMTKTDMTKEITSLTDKLRAGRKPVADNLFENQNPLLFSKLLQLLGQKDEKGNYTYFTRMPDDKNGNPVLILKIAVPGAFVTLNMPPHFKIDVEGKILAGARKDLRTQSYGSPESIVFNDVTLFLLPEEFERLQSKALNIFQKTVEPMLAKEIVKITRVAGKEVAKEVKANTTTAENLETAPPANEIPEQELDEMGNPI
jgi:hypothetical protein